MTDIEEIQQVMNAYGRNIDQRTIGRFADEVFTADAIVDISRPLVGIDEIIKDYVAQRDTYGSTAHLFSNLEVEIDGDTAHSTIYVAFWSWSHGEERRNPALAVYIDDLIRSPKGWRIVHRRLRAL